MDRNIQLYRPIAIIIVILVSIAFGIVSIVAGDYEMALLFFIFIFVLSNNLSIIQIKMRLRK